MKRKLLVLTTSLILILAVVIIRFARYYPIACDIYIENGVKGELTKEINDNLAKMINNENINYKDIAKLYSNEYGKATYISVDSAKISQIALILSNVIFENINNKSNDFKIPIGNALGLRLLSGKGKGITVTVIPVGSVAYEIKSELLSGGINQTLHRISIRFNVIAECVAPFHNSIITVENEIIIAETLIVGEVPDLIL